MAISERKLTVKLSLVNMQCNIAIAPQGQETQKLHSTLQKSRSSIIKARLDDCKELGFPGISGEHV